YDLGVEILTAPRRVAHPRLLLSTARMRDGQRRPSLRSLALNDRGEEPPSDRARHSFAISPRPRPDPCTPSAEPTPARVAAGSPTTPVGAAASRPMRWSARSEGRRPESPSPRAAGTSRRHTRY